MSVACATTAGQRPDVGEGIHGSTATSMGDTEEADMPLVGIGHLTMLDVAPSDWVSLAHEAGFDAVGIRPHAPTACARR